MYIMDRAKMLSIEGMMLIDLYETLTSYNNAIDNLTKDKKENLSNIQVSVNTSGVIYLDNGIKIKCIKKYYCFIDDKMMDNIKNIKLDKRNNPKTKFECNCVKNYFGMDSQKLFDCTRCHEKAIEMYKDKILTII